MMIVKLNLTEGTEKSPAYRARDMGPFPRVKKTGRFVIHKKALSDLAGFLNEKGGENINLRRHRAPGAGGPAGVEERLRNEGGALTALKPGWSCHFFCLFTTLVLQFRSCRARFSSSKPAMI